MTFEKPPFSARRCFLLLLAGLALGLPVYAIQVQAVSGPVYVQRGAIQQELTAGANLQQGDRLRSAADAEVLVRFDDGARLAMRSDSQLEITDLDTPAAAGLPKRTIELIKGGLRYISGQLSAHNHVVFNTQSAVIGIRGTDIELALVANAADKNEPGTYLKVNQGAAVLKAKDDTQVEVRAGHIAYGGNLEWMSKGGTRGPAARMLLTPVRGIFSPGRLDRLMQ
jgi:hypothetical protein